MLLCELPPEASRSLRKLISSQLPSEPIRMMSASVQSPRALSMSIVPPLTPESDLTVSTLVSPSPSQLSASLSHVASVPLPSLSSSSAPKVYELPPYSFLAEPIAFIWGSVGGASFCSLINNAYRSVVHWRKNLFRIPLGTLGREIVLELSRLFRE